MQDFKASPTDTITHALGNINIGEDDLDDEYDFMDDDDQDEDRQGNGNRKKPYHKYRDMMRQLADRKIEEVLVDLDDLTQV